MKQITCSKCGCTNAADFIVKILCPKKGCSNYDRKLADEYEQDLLKNAIKELEGELDFIAGPGSLITPIGHDDDDQNLYDLYDLDIDFDDDD